MEQPSAELMASLRRLGVIGATPPAFTPLPGGVSSEIWRVDLPDGPVCVKRALPQLRVAGEWFAPLERTRYEVAWMRLAGALVPGVCPTVVADDPGGAFVMSYLDPAQHRLWKSELLEGRADVHVAIELARRLGAIHQATAARPELRDSFDNPPLFDALRLDPYLTATARAHPDLAPQFAAVRASYLEHRVAVTHGDVSPKNVMVGADGPVLLDAECANWGDPAFDVAFCATHLHLKCPWQASSTDAFLACAEAFASAYLPLVSWEDPRAVESRVAAMVPALLLARVDGLSPVEYLDASARALVRQTARRLLIDAPTSLGALRHRWREAVTADRVDVT